jgi:hypothetical protein
VWLNPLLCEWRNHKWIFSFNQEKGYVGYNTIISSFFEKLFHTFFNLIISIETPRTFCLHHFSYCGQKMIFNINSQRSVDQSMKLLAMGWSVKLHITDHMQVRTSLFHYHMQTSLQPIQSPA